MAVKNEKSTATVPTPVDPTEIFLNVAKVLVPIASKWYELGVVLGFSTESLDKLKASSPSTPVTDLMFEVLKACYTSCGGDISKFVYALIVALEKPIIGAQYFASVLAQDFFKSSSEVDRSAEQYFRHLTPADAVIVCPLLQTLVDKWRSLGCLLGFHKDALTKIASSGGTQESYLNRVIGQWLCGDASQPPTLENLIAALKSPHINQEEIATELLKAYVNNSATTVSEQPMVNAALILDFQNLTPADAIIIRPLFQNLVYKWHSLGCLLGFDKDALTKIASLGGTQESYLNRVIERWLCGDASQPPTLENLIAALMSPHINQEEIILKLLKAYDDSSAAAHTIVREQPMVTAHIKEEVILSFLTLISSKWLILGVALGVSKKDLIKMLERDSTESEKCLQKIVSMWLSGHCKIPPTLESLLKVLNGPYVDEKTVAGTIEKELLKKTNEEVVEDGSGIRYPSLPQSDEEDNSDERGENKSGKKTMPPPGFETKIDAREKSETPALLRSLSDSQAPPSPSLETSGQSEGYSSDERLVAAAGGRVTKKLAASFNLPSNNGNVSKNSKLKCTKPSNLEGNNHMSGKSHGATDTKHRKTTKSSTPKPSETNEKCVICLDDFKDPVMTKCNHKFCQECFKAAYAASPYCAVCKYALRPIIGNQPPNGRMTYQTHDWSLPGYKHSKTIQIKYVISGGTQDQSHPNPGKRFYGTTRVAYLPGTAEGWEVLMLLQKAFTARLIFTVGRSVTTGTDDVVVWNDIHHKTSPSPGTYGYPDSTYLQRVKEDLAAKGIVPDDTSV